MARGAKPGERRGGRQKGTPNKATAEVKDLARRYGPDAIKEAAKLAGLINSGQGKAESEAARMAAINTILDRAYGKAAQPIDGDGDGGPIKTLSEIILRGVRSDA